ncbi:S-adenosylmethionine tRNA ribosyltransferase [Mycobacterium sp. 852002-51163_SCH5372311]|nr:S-adenosylmethionine tRNA ribosyltransferase [Mycobacterium sp. 852002-51163_SCH5372311]
MRQRLRSSMLALAESRGPGSSTCPSDAARAVEGENWRDLMPEALEIARELAESGDVQITKRGHVLDVLDASRDWRGPIRIRIRRR